ncbi:MAG: hypothetical protein A2033_01900 [Bacteroidetes bacterium GWA2_31_9]|nr:MAG: hypothetical protein A2033_01900 [Bacteroidetes bacterium GWA2_31_9]
MNKLYLFFAFLIFINLSTFAQKSDSKISREDYLKTYKDIAIAEMKRSGIPASITLSQGMLESDNGNSSLAKKAKNHFGIKCHNSWEGEKFIQDDDTKDECFRKYKNDEESFKDHTDFLVNGSRYKFLFDSKSVDYKEWAEGLKKAGYATNPKYPEMLIKIIEDNELYKFDDKDAAKNIQLANIDNVYLSSGNREIFLTNRIKCIKVRQGDTFFKISKELDIMLWQLYKYNDLDKDSKLSIGQTLYIQPKRSKAEAKFETHTVAQGETMQTISQLYGVKLKKLYKKNNLAVGAEIKVGDVVNLRSRKM